MNDWHFTKMIDATTTTYYILATTTYYVDIT